MLRGVKDLLTRMLLDHLMEKLLRHVVEGKRLQVSCNLFLDQQQKDPRRLRGLPLLDQSIPVGGLQGDGRQVQVPENIQVVDVGEVGNQIYMLTVWV